MLGIRGHINSKFFNHALGDLAIGSGTLDRKGSAVSEQKAVGRKLVALSVSTKVVVIIEDENPRLRSNCLAEKMRGGKPADASTDDHQVIGLASIDRFP